MKLITTSWDDGSPHDFRLAELLEKYNMTGTFYIPKHNQEHPVMDEPSVRALSRNFEIGGHTLNHVNLREASENTVELEVAGCHKWLEEVTGQEPKSFCIPFGKYKNTTVDAITRAGFTYIRTTELLDTGGNDLPSATTLQLYNHTKTTYALHLIKRARFGNLLTWLKGNSPGELEHLADYYIRLIDRGRGVFHLWGHSWEIEEFGLWKKLELIFKRISNISEFSYVTNRQLVDYCS